jgi:hypothetical protein
MQVVISEVGKAPNFSRLLRHLKAREGSCQSVNRVRECKTYTANRVSFSLSEGCLDNVGQVVRVTFDTVLLLAFDHDARQPLCARIT